jgi:hypothetical protein
VEFSAHILVDIPRMAQVTSDRMRCSGFVGKAKRQLRGCRGADALKFALVCDAHRDAPPGHHSRVMP